MARSNIPKKLVSHHNS